MGFFGTLTGFLGMDNSEFVSKNEASGKSIESFSKRGKSALKDLEEEFGRAATKNSAFGATLEALHGTGLGFGIKLAGEQFEKFADAVEKGAETLRKGDETTQEFLSDTARGIPLLGDFVKGFDSIREAITGEKAALEAQNAEWEETNKQIQAALKARDEFDKLGKEGIQTFSEGLRTDTQAADLASRTGVDKQLAQIQTDTENKIHKLNEDFAKYASTDAMAALEKQLANSKDALASDPNLASDGLHEKARQAELSHENDLQQQLNVLHANYATLQMQYQERLTAINAEGDAKRQDVQDKQHDDELKKQADFQKEMEQMQKEYQDHLKESADEVAKSLATPTEKYEAQILKLDDLFEKGAISMDTWKKGAAAAMKDLNSSSDFSEYRAPGAGAVRGGMIVQGPPPGFEAGRKAQDEAAKEGVQELREIKKLSQQQLDLATTGQVIVYF